MNRALILSALLLAAPASAQDAPRSLRVINGTDTPVNQLFATRSGARERDGVAGAIGNLVSPRRDAGDRLGSQSLDPGRSITVVLTGVKGCLVDLSAVLQDGRTYAHPGFDACMTERWVIGPGDRTD